MQLQLAILLLRDTTAATQRFRHFSETIAFAAFRTTEEPGRWQQRQLQRRHPSQDSLAQRTRTQENEERGGKEAHWAGLDLSRLSMISQGLKDVGNVFDSQPKDCGFES